MAAKKFNYIDKDGKLQDASVISFFEILGSSKIIFFTYEDLIKRFNMKSSEIPIVIAKLATKENGYELQNLEPTLAPFALKVGSIVGSIIDSKDPIVIDKMIKESVNVSIKFLDINDYNNNDIRIAEDQKMLAIKSIPKVNLNCMVEMSELILQLQKSNEQKLAEAIEQIIPKKEAKEPTIEVSEETVKIDEPTIESSEEQVETEEPLVEIVDEQSNIENTVEENPNIEITSEMPEVDKIEETPVYEEPIIEEQPVVENISEKLIDSEEEVQANLNEEENIEKPNIEVIDRYDDKVAELRENSDEETNKALNEMPRCLFDIVEKFVETIREQHHKDIDEMTKYNTEEIKNLNETIVMPLQKSLEKAVAQLKDLNKINEDLNNKLEEEKNKNQELENKNQELESKNSELQNEVSLRDRDLKDANISNNSHIETIKAREETIANLTSENEKKDQTIEEQNRKNSELENKLKMSEETEKQKEAEYEKNLALKDNEIDLMAKQKESDDNTINTLTSQVSAIAAENRSLQDQLKDAKKRELAVKALYDITQKESEEQPELDSKTL